MGLWHFHRENLKRNKAEPVLLKRTNGWVLLSLLIKAHSLNKTKTVSHHLPFSVHASHSSLRGESIWVQEKKEQTGKDNTMTKHHSGQEILFAHDI